MARRTQAERSAATRALLLDAAIASLVEHGWAATTSVEVCARAGVTRGALVHHFPSLPSLLAAALQTIYDDAAPPGPPPGGEAADPTVLALIEATWERISERRFKAMLEAWLAMANDPELAADIGPVVANFAGLVDPDRLAPDVLGDPMRRTYYLMARETMLGLALGRATNGGRPLPHEDAVLDQLRRAAAQLDEEQ
jgi:AcrR family transcriptional regulator